MADGETAAPPTRGPSCPGCGASAWTVYSLRHPLLWFWLACPVFAFNELLLGQRMPRRTMLCRACECPIANRSYVPCPHCGAVHPGGLWSMSNAMWNWFGYGCPSCARAIPCLWNVGSLVVLAITWPLWVWPVRRVRERAVARQVARAREALRRGVHLEVWGFWRWVGFGITRFGGALFVLNALMLLFLSPARRTYLGPGFWLGMLASHAMGGALWGALVGWVMGLRGRRRAAMQEPTGG